MTVAQEQASSVSIGRTQSVMPSAFSNLYSTTSLRDVLSQIPPYEVAGSAAPDWPASSPALQVFDGALSNPSSKIRDFLVAFPETAAGCLIRSRCPTKSGPFFALRYPFYPFGAAWLFASLLQFSTMSLSASCPK